MSLLHQVIVRQLLGESPRQDALFFACGAKDWRKQGQALALSINAAYESSPSPPSLHAHVVNPTEADLAKLVLFDRMVAMPFTFTFEQTELDELSPIAVAGYLDRNRFLTAAKLRQNDVRLLLLDVNVLLTKPVAFPNSAVGYVSRKNAGPAKAISQALFVSSAGHKFLERVRNVLCEDSLCPRKNDAALQRVMREHRKEATDWTNLGGDFFQSAAPSESPFIVRRNELLRSCDWSALS